MTNRLAILTAAASVALGTAGFAFAQDNTNQAQPADQQQQQSQTDQQNQASNQNQTNTDTARGQTAPDKKEIAGVLGQITSAAVQGKYDDMAERFSKQDRERLKDLKSDQSATNWDQFSQNWKNKYGKEFDSDNAQTAFNSTSNIQFLSGDITEQARMAGERMQPGSVSGSTGNTNANPSGATGATGEHDTTSGTGATGNASSNGASGSASAGGVGVSGSVSGSGASANADTTRDRNTSGSNAPGSGTAAADQAQRVNKNMATVVIPASHGQPPATLHFINEGTLTDAWRLDLPDTVDATKLQQSLDRHIAMINQDQSQWPGDVNDAYTMVAHHVALALQDAGGMPQLNAPGSGQQPQNQQPGQSSNGQ